MIKRNVKGNIKRNTIQKQMVLESVRNSTRHPNAEEVYSEILKKYPGISKATVYRNLHNLVKDGLVVKLTVPGEADRYDRAPLDHNHAVCKKCGKFMDINVSFPEIDFNDKIFKEKMIDDFSLLFFGVCEECQKTPEKEAIENQGTV